jgi:plastocyanin
MFVMRVRSLTLSVLFVLLPVTLLAKEVMLPIAGSVGVFRTDTRVLNPSFENDITITATFYPGKGFEATIDPAGPPVVREITVPKREMAIFDDVVSTLFNASGLGAIKLSSDGEFFATQRIYALTDDGTLGQFVVGADAGAARTRGVLIQLKANGTAGMQGTFRTNIGLFNSNAADASVTIRLYDRSNAVAGQPVSIVLRPNAVMTPGSIAAIFGDPAADLSDSWISFESDQPIFAYASVVDNGTTDPTFIPPFDDVASPDVDDPPATQTVIVGLGNIFSPSELTIREGDTVTWEFRDLHTTTSDATTGPEVWDSGSRFSGTFSHTFTTVGNFPYHCALHSVPGGTAMNGVIRVLARVSGGGPQY